MTAAVAIDQAPGSLPLANARHERFCHEYIVDHNGTAAYLRVGYKCTEPAAAASASDLLRNPKVADRVAYLEAARLERVGMTADEVLRELKVLGESSVSHYTVDERGNVKLADDAPESALRAVSGVKIRRRTFTREDGATEETIDTEFKLWSKPAALRMAGEVHKLYTQKVEQTPTPQQPDTGEAVMQRVAQALPLAIAFLQGDQRVQALKQLAAVEIVVEPKGGKK